MFVINSSKVVVSKFISAEVAPIATMFFISAVPSSLAVLVNGKSISCALQPSGFVGLALESAIIILSLSFHDDLTQSFLDQMQLRYLNHH